MKMPLGLAGLFHTSFLHTISGKEQSFLYAAVILKLLVLKLLQPPNCWLTSLQLRILFRFQEQILGTGIVLLLTLLT